MITGEFEDQQELQGVLNLFASIGVEVVEVVEVVTIPD